MNMRTIVPIETSRPQAEINHEQGGKGRIEYIPHLKGVSIGKNTIDEGIR